MLPEEVVNIAESTQENVETPVQETAPEGTTTNASNTAAPADKGEREEAVVPSWRLREESEKRRQAEEELARFRGQQAAANQPNVGDIRSAIRKNLKPTLNQETGEYEFTDEGINTLTWLIEKGVNHLTGPMTNKMVNSEIKAQKAELKDKPYYKKLEPEIDKALSSLNPQQRMQDGVVESIYKYLRGEKFEELAKEEISKTTQRPQIVGDITPNRAKSTSGSQATVKLTSVQMEEYNKDWAKKGFDTADYVELLDKMKEQDSKKGYKTQRETINQSISS